MGRQVQPASASSKRRPSRRLGAGVEPPSPAVRHRRYPHTTTSAATAAAAAAILCVGAPSAVRRRIELNSYCASQRLGAGVEPPFPRTAPDSAGRGYSRPHTTTSDPTPPHTHPSAPARHNTWAWVISTSKNRFKHTNGTAPWPPQAAAPCARTPSSPGPTPAPRTANPHTQR